MKNRFLFFLTCLLMIPSVVRSQTSSYSADLLNVVFKADGSAIDNSSNKFSILKGSLAPIVTYDSEAKQYVSQFRTNSVNQFFRFNYGSNSNFVKQISESFTIELYTKALASYKIVPFGATQAGGLGAAQNDQSGNKFWFFQNNNQYAFSGGGSFYNSSNTKYDHIVYTYDQATKTISYYQNGKLLNTVKNIYPLKLPAQVYQWFFIGGDVSAQDNKAELMYFGDIASVKMYSKALSASEVSATYTERVNRSSIQEMDELNSLINDNLPNYIKNQTNAAIKDQANAYLKEGWELMYFDNTKKEQVVEYLKKVNELLDGYIPPVDNTVSQAELFNIIFMDNSRAKDVSSQNFAIDHGASTPYNFYDAEIKQYASKFTNYSANRTSRFYSVDYRSNDNFKKKMTESFSVELYIKINDNKKVIAPMASTQGTGFGVSQAVGGGQLQFLFADGTGYKTVGGKSIYSTTPKYDHIVYTYNHTTRTLKSYYNGEYQSQIITSGKLILPTIGNQYLFIGGDVTGDTKKDQAEFPFEGDVARVRIYSRCLDTKEIDNLHDQLTARKYITKADDLNEIISNKLPAYIDSQKDVSKNNKAEEYLTEGWDLMNSFTTTQEEIEVYLNKVNKDLGLDSTIETQNVLPRFAVITDVHLRADTNKYGSQTKMRKTIEILNKQKDNLDAIFITGDLTDSGFRSENELAASFLSTVSPKIPIYTLMGNHDVWNSGMTNFVPQFGVINRMITIKGYPAIILSEDKDEAIGNGATRWYHYTQGTLDFLSNSLAEASKNYPNKPIFVFTHISAPNTTLGSAEGDFGPRFFSRKLNEILVKYQQVILFTGHLHTPIGDERSIYQENFTSVNAGTLAYATHLKQYANKPYTEPLSDNDDTYGNNNTLRGGTQVGEGLIVEVEPTKDVKITRWDFNRDIEIKTPWIVKYPHTKDNFIYTNKRDGGEAPYFETGSQMTFSGVTVSFPQAKDDDLVDYYNIKVWKGNEVTNYNISSLFHLNSDMPATLSWNVNYARGNRVEIRAIDSFGNVSAPLSNQAVTKSASAIENVTETPVIISDKNQIRVHTNGLVIDKAVIYNLRGNVVDVKLNQSSDFILGENSISGIYIVNISYNGNVLNQKVLIQ